MTVDLCSWGKGLDPCSSGQEFRMCAFVRIAQLESGGLSVKDLDVGLVGEGGGLTADLIRLFQTSLLCHWFDTY